MTRFQKGLTVRLLVATVMLVFGIFAASLNQAVLALVCGILATSWFYSWKANR